MKLRFLSALAIATLLFASCSKDNDAPETTDGQVKFSSGVSANHTKVGGMHGDQWEGNERIGIYMVGHTDQAVKEGAENIEYTTASTGSSATFNATSPIYYPVDAAQKVDFIAYHPYSASVSSYVYSIDITDQSNQSAIDLMRAKADNAGSGYDKTQSTSYVNLVFDHKLTKVIINTTPDAGITQIDLANMTVTIKGLNTKADYTINADVLGAPNTVAPIAARTTTAGTLYEAIVVPQSFAGGVVTMEFALNNAKNEVFVYSVPATTFAAAERHEFNVKVQRTGVQVRGTINPWSPIGAINGTAN